MNEILDDGFKEINDIEKRKINSEIKEIESKNWYGFVLICIVISLILISTILYLNIIGFSIPLIVLNSLLIGIHVLMLFLSKHDKLLAYAGGLLTFIMTIVLNLMLAEVIFLGRPIIIITVVGAYSIFIYEELKLKKLKRKLLGEKE